MKKILSFFVLAIAFAYVGNAQSSFHAGYQHMTVQAKDQEGSRCNSNGALIGWQYRMKANNNVPLYITLGAELNWNWSRVNTSDNLYDEFEDKNGTKVPVEVKGEEHYKTNFGGLKVPVNFAYEFQVSKTKPLFIIPQIGIHAYCNFDAHQQFEGKYDVYKRNTEQKITTVTSHDSYGMIGSHDLGVYSYHRIVAGWQIGCSVRYDHYIIGGTFEQELLHLTDYGHSTTFTIKLGYEL